MTDRVRFGLRVNNDLDVDALDAIAAAADTAGLDRLWLSNDMFLASAAPLLGRLAGRTERVGLGIGIANPYSVHPAELAMLASTLDDLSGGRFALGLGAGARGFLAAVGLERARPLRVVDDAITAVRSLLAGQPVALEGWDHDARLARPAPGVPIFVGATGPRMRALAGRRADGVLALMLPPEIRHRVQDEVAAGRDGASGPVHATDERFELPTCVWLSVDDDADAARAALAPKLALYGPELGDDLLAAAGLEATDFEPIRRVLAEEGPSAAGRALTPAMRSLAIVGDVDEVTARCADLLEDGVDHLSFGPPIGPDPVRSTGIVIERVLTRLVRRR